MVTVISPTLVGRDNESRWLEQRIADAVDGAGGLVVVSGEAGIGKTRLVREALRAAESTGARILWGRTAQALAPAPFRPLTEAFQSGLVDGDLDRCLDGPYRAAVRVVVPEPGGAPTTTNVPLLAAAEATLRLLQSLSATRGAVLVLDDVQWADGETLAIIEYLADKLEGHRLLVVLIERTASGPPAEDITKELVARRVAEQVPLRPLAPSDVENIARLATQSEDIDPGLRRTLHEHSAGVPFLIEEMLTAWLEADEPSRPQTQGWMSRRIAEALPPSYREIVRHRLESLDADARKVVTAAALLGRTFEWQPLTRIVSLPEDAVLEVLRRAVAAQVVIASPEEADAFEFRHALAREAILADLLPGEREQVSLEAGRAIEWFHPGLPGMLCQQAAELLEAGGDRGNAFRLMIEATRRALNQSAIATAEHILTRAQSLIGDDYTMWWAVRDLDIDLGYLSGDADRAAKAGQRIIRFYDEHYRDIRRPGRMADLHIRVARALLACENPELAHEHIQAAGRFAHESNDETTVVRVAVVEARQALLRRDVQHAQSLLSPYVEGAGATTDGSILRDVLEVAALAAFDAGDLAEATRIFARLEVESGSDKVAIHRIRALLGLGTIDNLAGRDLDRLIEARHLAVTTGAIALMTECDLELARAHLFLGEVGRARGPLDECLELSRRHGLVSLAGGLGAMAMLHALENDPGAVDVITDEAASLLATPAMAEVLAQGRGVRWIAAGDDARALTILNDAAKACEGRPWWLGLRALLVMASGRGVDSSAFVDAPDPVNRAYSAYASSIARGSQARPAEAQAAVAEGDGLMPPGWRLHHARRVVAAAALEQGWGEPLLWLQDAQEFFEAQSLPRLADSCKPLLRQGGVKTRRPRRGTTIPTGLSRQGVTSRELDVLQLLPERLTYAVMGERLFISPRTVESHVRSLVQKLGVASREELIALAPDVTANRDA